MKITGRLLPSSVVALLLALVGCGAARPRTSVTVAKVVLPAHPIYAECEIKPAPHPRAVRFDARNLLGLTVDAAQRVAYMLGCEVRVVEENGERPSDLEFDESGKRIDVVVADHKIVRVKGVY